MSSVTFAPLSTLAEFRTRLQGRCRAVEAALNRNFWPVALGATASLFAFLLIKDLVLRLWSDEIYAIMMAKLPSIKDIGGAAMGGADSAPPMYSGIIHGILPFSPSEALAVRLPATVGFCAMVLATFAFGHRRLPGLYALSAGILAAAPSVYFGSEGRAYGLVLGFAAVSLLLWSLAADHRSRAITIPLLALSTAFLAASHYYGVFFVGCLFVADLFRAANNRRFDFPLAIALLAPPVIVIALHYPFIVAARQIQAHFWAQPHLGSIPHFYKQALRWVIPLFAVAMIAATVAPEAPTTRPRATVALPSHELAALVLLALAPAGVVLATMVTTHIFTDRYAIWSLAGIALLSTAILCQFARNNAVVGVAVLAALTVGFAGKEVVKARHWAALRESQAMFEELSKLPDSATPIVVPYLHQFLELSRYAPPRLSHRLVFPICDDLDLRYRGNDTDALLVLGLRRWVSLNADSCDAVLDPRREYVLAATSGDYLPWVLADKGYAVKPVELKAANPLDAAGPLNSASPIVFRVGPEEHP